MHIIETSILFIEEHLLIIIFFQSALLVAIVSYLQKKRILASFFFLLSAFSISYLQSIYGWLGKLGSDSFSEIQGFSRDEALFFIQTALQILAPFTFKQMVLIVLTTAFTFIPIYIATRKHILIITGIKLIAAAVLLLASTIMFADVVSKYQDNSKLFSSIKNNFIHPPVTGEIIPNDLTAIVYIGEATSALNLNLYGYPRPTTPLLGEMVRAGNNLLVFENIFSTHTHTTNSLLEALSISSGEEETGTPIDIFKRKRVSLVDILVRSGVETHWISNQNQSGSWNFASAILAGSATTALWSVNSQFAPNSNDLLARPNDHEFFVPLVQGLLKRKEPQAIFLHSYTGHGPYASNIPPDFRTPVDDLMSRMSHRAVFGDINYYKPLNEDVDEYDSAMRYIDFSLSQIIEITENTDKPTILVYFSDHGESVLTGRGHDSSRFIHEMVRIPFLIYFNERAVNKYPVLFEKLTRYSKAGRSSTLAQFPATLLNLFGLQVTPGPGDEHIIGESTTRNSPDIVIRDTVDGKTFVSLSNKEIPGRKTESKNTADTATRIFAARTTEEIADKIICYHRSNSWAKAIRGSQVASCLEFDVFVEQDGFVGVHHPPVTATGLNISELLRIATHRKLAVWIDAKNIDEAGACNSLLEQLTEFGISSLDVLVEFPSTTPFDNEWIARCADQLKQMNIATSFYVPTSLSTSCSDNISDKEPIDTHECGALEEILKQAGNSGIFTDFSFDFSGLNAMRELHSAGELRWNTWGVNAEDLQEIDSRLFRMIIVNSSDDPNQI